MSRSYVPQWVLVDDTDSDIKYFGRSWFSDVGSWDSVGRTGKPYLSTRHGTNSNASFTFDFKGTAIRVMGSNSQTSSGARDPLWSCMVDGVLLDPKSFNIGPSNNYLLCDVIPGVLDDGPHSLTVNATVAGGNNQTFWFDRIEYVPSKQASLEQRAILVGPDDPQIQHRALLFDTYTSFLVTFPFYGISIGYYGSIYRGFDTNKNNLSWSIDQTNTTNSTWSWSRPASTQENDSLPLYEQQFFESSTYPIGNHTLRVKYLINSVQDPELRLDYLIVQNVTLSSRSTSGSSSLPSSTTSISPGPLETKGTGGATSSGVIAGGVIGGVLILSIAVLVFYYFRRRWLNSKRRNGIDESIPFELPKIPANTAVSPQPHPVQRKSRFLVCSDTDAANPPSSSHNSYRTQPTDEASTSVANGLGIRHAGDHGLQLRPTWTAQQDTVAVNVRQSQQLEFTHAHLDSGPSRVAIHQDSGVRLNREILATSIIDLPPRYTEE